MIGILHPVARPLAAPFGSALAARAFSWRNLFAGGTPGFRINIEEALRINAAAVGDLSKCVAFQDSAGTLPVTAMEQPLGLILDTKLGVPVRGPELVVNGENITSTSGWGAFNGGTLSVSGGSLTVTNGGSGFSGAAAGGLGTVTVGKTYAIQIVVSGGTATNRRATIVGVTNNTLNLGVNHFILTAASSTTTFFINSATIGETLSISRYSVRELPGNHFIQPDNTPSRSIVSRRVNLLTATTTLATQSVTTLAASHVLAFSGTGSVTLSGTATGTYSAGTHTITTTAGTLTVTVSGSVTNADLRLSIDANLPQYQRVTSPTDYDEVGFPAYAKFDGVDDWLESGVVDMTSTDEVTVLAGVTKLSDAAYQNVLEFSTNSDSVNGSFGIGTSTLDGDAARRSYGFSSTGQTFRRAAAGVYAAPSKHLLTGIGKIGTDTSVLRVNGSQVAANTSEQGTGNYTAQKFYMGRRGGSSLPLNGRIYGVTVVGKLLTSGQLAAAERAERNLGRLY